MKWKSKALLGLKYVYFSHVYWGEYPLFFAACLSQEECYRLVLAKGANPDNQDTNGNNVIHLMVIHEKIVSAKVYGIIFFILHSHGIFSRNMFLQNNFLLKVEPS